MMKFTEIFKTMRNMGNRNIGPDMLCYGQWLAGIARSLGFERRDDRGSFPGSRPCGPIDRGESLVNQGIGA